MHTAHEQKMTEDFANIDEDSSERSGGFTELHSDEAPKILADIIKSDVLKAVAALDRQDGKIRKMQIAEQSLREQNRGLQEQIQTLKKNWQNKAAELQEKISLQESLRAQREEEIRAEQDKLRQGFYCEMAVLLERDKSLGREFSAERERLTQEISALKSQLGNSQAEIKNFEKLLRENEEKFELILQEAGEANSLAKESRALAQREFHQKMNQFTDQVWERDLEIQRLSAVELQAADLKKTNDNLLSKLAQKDFIVSQISAELKSLRIAAADGEVEKQKNLELRSDLDLKNALTAQLTAEVEMLNQVKTDAEDLRAKNIALSSDLAQKDRALAEAASEIEGLHFVEEDHRVQKEKGSQIQAQLTRVTAELEKFIAEQQVWLEEKADFEGEVADLSTEIRRLAPMETEVQKLREVEKAYGMFKIDSANEQSRLQSQAGQFLATMEAALHETIVSGQHEIEYLQFRHFRSQTKQREEARRLADANRHRHQQLASENDVLRRERAKLKIEFVAQDEKIEAGQIKIRTLTTDLQGLQNQIDVLRDQAHEANRQLVLARDEHAAALSLAHNIGRERDLAHTTIQALKSEIIVLKGECDNLSGRLETSRSALAAKEQDRAEIAARVERLAGELNQAASEQRATTYELSALRSAFELKTAEAAKTANELREATNHRDEIIEQMRILKAQLADTQTKLGETQGKFDTSSAARDQLSQTLSTATAELSRAREELSATLKEFTDSKARHGKELSEFQEKIYQRSLECRDMKADLVAATAQLEAKKIEVVQLQMEVRKAHERNQDFDQVDAARVNQMRLQIGAREQQLRIYAKALTKEKVDLQAFSQQLASEIRALAETHPLRDYIRATEHELGRLEVQLRTMPMMMPERPRLEAAVSQLVEQREFLSSVLTDARKQMGTKLDFLNKVISGGRLGPVPPPPPERGLEAGLKSVAPTEAPLTQALGESERKITWEFPVQDLS